MYNRKLIVVEAGGAHVSYGADKARATGESHFVHKNLKGAKPA